MLLLTGVYASAVAAIELLAASTVHFGNGWMFANTNGGWEYPIFLAISAAVMALGAFALKPQAPI